MSNAFLLFLLSACQNIALSKPARPGQQASLPDARAIHLSAHHIHIIAMMAITIAPDAMNTASDCQKEKFPP
jgi:hypothetical protein